MLDKNILSNLKKAAELELEGLQKILTAQKMALGEMPAEEAVPVNDEGVTVLKLSETEKEASLSLLKQAADEMKESDDEEIVKQASELESIMGLIQKNAFVMEKDPEDSILGEHMGDRKIEGGLEGTDIAKELEGDDTTEVQKSVPFQKV